MKVTREFMVKLRSHARDYCGGYKHVLEVQTWDDRIDIGDMTEQEQDEADISHFDLIDGVELPDNAEQIDIQVWGVEFKAEAGEVTTEADMNKLGYFYIALKDGVITETWQ
jgi:hypothetical protein